MSSVKPGQDADIDLGQLFRAIWERRVRIGVITLGVTALAFVGAKLIKPDYQSETQLLIELRSPDFAEKVQSASSNSDPILDDLGIASQVQVLQSLDLIKKVARDLKLYERVEFDPDANPSFIKRLLVSFGLMKNPLDVPPEERVLKAFKEKLEVYQVEKSRVIGVQFTSNDPKLAALVPNTMAQTYLSLQSGAKLDTDTEATRWLEPEIATLREKVKLAEEKVANYRSSTGLLKTGADQTFADQQLNDISAEIAKVQSDMATAQARAQSVRNALKSGGPVDTIADVMASPTIQRLKEQESTVQGQISDLSITLLDGHPRIKSLKAQLAGLRQQINVETRKILASLENEAGVAKLKMQQLNGQLNTLKANAAQAGEQQVDLNALEREAKAQRDLLETYLSRYREAASRAGKDAAPADARIISNAVVPTDVHFPKVIPILVVAAVASLIINSVVIMLNELFTGRAWKEVNPAPSSEVKLRDDDPIELDHPAQPSTEREASGSGMLHNAVQKARDLLSALSPKSAPPAPKEVLAVTPTVRDAGEEEDEGDFSIASVAKHVALSPMRVAVCISPDGDDGSTASVELARRISVLGLRTILIDMTGSGLPSRLMLGTMDLAGITDILADGSTIAGSIHGDVHSNAHIIPHGNADPAKAMRGVDRLTMIVGALGEAYEKVVIECGPIDGSGADRLTRNGDAEIVVSLPGASETEVAALLEEFQKSGQPEFILMSGKSAVSNGGKMRVA